MTTGETSRATAADRDRAGVRNVIVNGVRLHVEEEGARGETIVFSHGMLRSCRMFDAQVAALRDRYRCIRYDHRGQGASEATRDAVIDLETVYGDAVALIEAVDATPCHWIGLSMGGMVGMRLAARRPELVRSVVLLETSAERDRPGAAIQGRLSLAVMRLLPGGPAARLLLEPTMRIFYGQSFRTDAARRDEYLAERASMERSMRATAPAVVRGVLGRAPVVDELSRITAPALVLVGDEDAAIPPAMARRLSAAIPGARFEVIAGAGHTSTVEQPQAVTAVIESFLAGLPR